MARDGALTWLARRSVASSELSAERAAGLARGRATVSSQNRDRLDAILTAACASDLGDY
jgi:hypothetical protein